MGNSATSAQLPARADDRRGVARSRRSEKESDAASSSVAVRAAVKVGTAVARTLLMVYGACSSANSPRSEHPIEDDRHRRDMVSAAGEIGVQDIFGGGRKGTANFTLAEERFYQLGGEGRDIGGGYSRGGGGDDTGDITEKNGIGGGGNNRDSGTTEGHSIGCGGDSKGDKQKGVSGRREELAKKRDEGNDAARMTKEDSIGGGEKGGGYSGAIEGHGIGGGGDSRGNRRNDVGGRGKEMAKGSGRGNGVGNMVDEDNIGGRRGRGGRRGNGDSGMTKGYGIGGGGDGRGDGRNSIGGKEEEVAKGGSGGIGVGGTTEENGVGGGEEREGDGGDNSMTEEHGNGGAGDSRGYGHNCVGSKGEDVAKWDSKGNSVGDTIEEGIGGGSGGGRDNDATEWGGMEKKEGGRGGRRQRRRQLRVSKKMKRDCQEKVEVEDTRNDERRKNKRIIFSVKNYQKSASRAITFMTYNVWKQEGENLQERIKKIGSLVEKHSPDVIFFQEVTPNINRMFRTFGWWDDYNCSDSSDNAIEGDFCIVLSKFPIKAKRCVSSIARKLPGCELNVGIGRQLYVANGHLKRPNPPGMHCCEIRKTQAKEAMKLLNCSRNAVFGGDMNWDEHRDGQFPLPKRWVDAWTRLKPNNNGWTYDTKSNKSLKGRKLLQKRLDRFVCKLRDFTLKDIKIIGNDAEPPSDHYGLLLTICYK